MRPGTWAKPGHEPLTGHWEYYRPSDKFIIRLDSKSRRRVRKPERFEIQGEDHPEWNGWKLVHEERPQL